MQRLFFHPPKRTLRPPTPPPGMQRASHTGGTVPCDHAQPCQAGSVTDSIATQAPCKSHQLPFTAK